MRRGSTLTHLTLNTYEPLAMQQQEQMTHLIVSTAAVFIFSEWATHCPSSSNTAASRRPTLARSAVSCKQALRSLSRMASQVAQGALI